MAQQSTFYFTDGSTRTFPSTKHIATKQHVAVYFQLVSDNSWQLIEISEYSLIGQSIVFTTAPDLALYSQIEIRVADTANELEESPSNIALVAGAATEIITVSDNIASVATVSGSINAVNNVSAGIADVAVVSANILDIGTVADNALAVADVSTNMASVVDAVNQANTAIANAALTAADVLTTNGDVALTHADVALTHADVVLTHADVVSSGASATSASSSVTSAQLRAWEAEAERMTADSYATEAEDVVVKIYTSDGDGTFTATPTTEYSALHYKNKAAASALPLNEQIHNATTKTTSVDADEFGIVDSADGNNLKKTTWANIKSLLSAIFAPIVSPAFIGTPTAPTPTAGDNSTKLATTAFVQNEISTLSFNTATAFGDYAVGSYAEGYDPTEETTASTTMIPLKGFKFQRGGTVTFSFKIRNASTSTTSAQLYKNGAPIGTLRSTIGATGVTYTENISFSAGDVIDVYVKTSSGTYAAFLSDFKALVSNPSIIAVSA